MTYTPVAPRSRHVQLDLPDTDSEYDSVQSGKTVSSIASSIASRLMHRSKEAVAHYDEEEGRPKRSSSASTVPYETLEGMSRRLSTGSKGTSLTDDLAASRKGPGSVVSDNSSVYSDDSFSSTGSGPRYVPPVDTDALSVHSDSSIASTVSSKGSQLPRLNPTAAKKAIVTPTKGTMFSRMFGSKKKKNGREV